MLNISRVRIEIETVERVYKIDNTYESGLNVIIYKDDIWHDLAIASINYCMCLINSYEMIEVTNEFIIANLSKQNVNGNKFQKLSVVMEIIGNDLSATLSRIIEPPDKNANIAYYTKCESINEADKGMTVFVEFDEYIAFLGSLLKTKLTFIRTNENIKRKTDIRDLYQFVFSEQMNTWSNFAFETPLFRVMESNKCIVEYILGLDSLYLSNSEYMNNENKRKIEVEWEVIIALVLKIANDESCIVKKLPRNISEFHESISKFEICLEDGSLIDEEIDRIGKECDDICKLKLHDNSNELLEQMAETESNILDFENLLTKIASELAMEDGAVKMSANTLEIMELDISNHKDSLSIRNLGLDALGKLSSVFNGRQRDSLLPSDTSFDYLSIEDNLALLNEQKKMFEFSLRSRIGRRDLLKSQKEEISNKLYVLRLLKQSACSSLTAPSINDLNDTFSHLVKLSNRIERLNKMKHLIESLLEQLNGLATKWFEYQEQDKKTRHEYSKRDLEKIELLRCRFIENIKDLNYFGILNFENIEISLETLFPSVCLDRKYRKDKLKCMWAYVFAMLQVSSEKQGNHPHLLIFNDPAVDNLTLEDVENFTSLASRYGCQIVISTSESTELAGALVSDCEHSSCHVFVSK